MEIYTLYIGHQKQGYPRTPILCLSDKRAWITYHWRNLPRFPHVFETYDIEFEDVEEYSQDEVSEMSMWADAYKWTWEFLDVFPTRELAEKETNYYFFMLEAMMEVSGIGYLNASELKQLKKYKDFL